MSKNKLILEFTEFNAQRMNSDSVQVSTHVNNPQLSTDAFDKHQDGIRQAMSRIGNILFNIKGTTSYSALISKLSIEDQDLEKLTILRIVKKDGVDYDVYVKFIIKQNEYWGVITNILSIDPKFKSEVFNDTLLYQPEEWVIKTKGLIIKTIKAWLKPTPGIYKILNDYIICYSTVTGKQIKISKDSEVELIRSHDQKIIIKCDNDLYNIVDDNLIYFNWWFEKIDIDNEN